MADSRMKPWAKFPMAKKPRKYRNVKTVVDGIKFDSMREAERWQFLSLLKKAGKISELSRQVEFVILPAVVLDGRKRPATKYLADFSYRNEAGELVVEDVKSEATKTPIYQLKRKMVKVVHFIEVKEV